MYFALKILVSAFIIAIVSELSKRSSFMAALIVSLPLISILSFIWIYLETKDVQKIIELSYSVFWLVIPSLAFFLLLPWLLKQNMGFFAALLFSCAALGVIYVAGNYAHELYISRKANHE